MTRKNKSLQSLEIRNSIAEFLIFIAKKLDESSAIRKFRIAAADGPSIAPHALGQNPEKCYCFSGFKFGISK